MSGRRKGVEAMMLNKRLLVAALGLAIVHTDQSVHRPRRFAYTVWDRLIEAMNADNGCKFKPTEDQKEAAIPHIIRMVEAGHFQDDHTDLKSSYWIMVAGEEFERIHRFMNCDGFTELDRILNEVFDGAIEP